MQHPAPPPRLGWASAAAIMFCTLSASVSGAPVVLPPGATPNVASIASALQTTCDRLSAASATSSLDPTEQDFLHRCAFFENPGASPAALSSAYAAIVGQQVNALGPQAKKFATLEQDNLAARMADIRHGSTGLSLTGLQLRGDDGHLLAANNIVDFLPAADSIGGNGASSWWDNRLGVFVNGSVKLGSKRPSQNAFAFDVRDQSITAGVDYRVTDWFVVGVDYASGHTKTIFENNLGRIDLKANGGSLFALAFAGPFYLDALAGYGGTDLGTVRDLDYTESGGGLISQQAIGSAHIQELWAGISVGDELTLGPLVLTPEASLNFHEIRLHGFTESMSVPDAPGAGLALSYGDAVVPSTQGRLNLRLGYTWSTPWAVIVPQAHASFIREFRNRSDAFGVRFAADTALGSPDAPAYLKTDAPEGHYWANGGGFTAQFQSGIAVSFDYEQLRTLKTIKSHEFTLGARYEFRK